jgi:hypothetical protein
MRIQQAPTIKSMVTRTFINTCTIGAGANQLSGSMCADMFVNTLGISVYWRYTGWRPYFYFNTHSSAERVSV